MNVIVAKFGGSSTADADCFRRVREIIRSHSRRKYIILSAPGRRSVGDDKITSLLIRAHALRDSPGSAEALAAVRERFEQIICRLGLETDPDIFLGSLESDVRHSPDFAASRGEYLCARLFAEYTDMSFVDASSLIFFDKNGRVQRDKTYHAVHAMAKRNPCAVIPGFYGSMPDGSIRTFTRGGSDISGALIAAALNAEIYENWTDVDGLMSADPAVCPDAAYHPAVSYRQMRLLAKAGAQVLHPYCVEPVCEAGIPTVLKNTFAPESPGTYISDCVHRNVCCICARPCRIASVERLSDEAREIALGLNAEVYSNGWIVLDNSEDVSIGERAAVISVFGLPQQFWEKAAALINPIGELNTEHCSKYLLSPEQAEAAQRTLHALLRPILTDSRIPSDCGGPYRPMP